MRGTITKINATQPKSKRCLSMPWKKCISVGRAFDLTRYDLINHLRYAQEKIGYEYCRFHAIFDDDMDVVTRTEDGKLVFRWHQVDKVYDSLIVMGIRPFVELNSMPTALASGNQTMFDYKMNVTPPKSYEEWGMLILEFMKHIIYRYGLQEVRTWYFEVWNEPNLEAFWSGSQEDYWKLYETSVKVIKEIDKDLRVGGPASSKGQWITEIINHCHGNNLPLDFVSTHMYSQDEFVEYRNKAESPHATGMFFQDRVRSVKKEVESSPMPNLPIFWTEWNTLSAYSPESVDWLHNPTIDNLYSAACLVRNSVALDEDCDIFCYWVVSDIFVESGLKHTPFSCTYGMMTIHGIPKATFNGFYLLNKMQGEILEISSSSSFEVGNGLIATKELDMLRVLLWNHQPLEMENRKETWEGQLHLSENEGTYHLVSAKITEEKGSAYEAWLKMGKPSNLTLLQMEYLQASSQMKYDYTQVIANENVLSIDFEVRTNEVLFFELALIEEKTSKIATISNEMLESWNQGMGKKTKELK